jgi:ParB family chromosome partitioning protein
VAGERRLRAAQSLGWSAIPARVVELDDRQTCELALVENLQRKDLNAIEKARAFERYLAQFHATHEELARQLGIDRSTVTNMVRLLELPDAVQEMVVAGRLSSGHGRALLTVEDPIAQWTLATQSADEGLSVRQTEALVREHRSRSASGVPTEVGPVEQAAVETGPEAHADTELASAVPEEERSHHLDSIENELRQRLGIRVQIHAKGHEGSITLHFGSGDDFERILDQLRR